MDTISTAYNLPLGVTGIEFDVQENQSINNVVPFQGVYETVNQLEFIGEDGNLAIIKATLNVVSFMLL